MSDHDALPEVLPLLQSLLELRIAELLENGNDPGVRPPVHLERGQHPDMTAALECGPSFLETREFAVLSTDLVAHLPGHEDHPTHMVECGGEHAVQVRAGEVDADHRVEHTDRVPTRCIFPLPLFSYGAGHS